MSNLNFSSDMLATSWIEIQVSTPNRPVSGSACSLPKFSWICTIYTSSRVNGKCPIESLINKICSAAGYDLLTWAAFDTDTYIL